MKTIFRILGLCALSAFAFTACEKADNNKVMRFTATISQPETKTHASESSDYLVWDEGDKILVCNPAGESKEYVVSSIDEHVATFTVSDPEKVDFVSQLETQDFTAFYPNAVSDGENVRMAIPSVQTHVPNHNFPNGTYPMVGFNEGTNFCFQSNVGFLNVSVIAQGGINRSVDRVVLSANEDIAGTMVYAVDGLSYVFEGESNVITLIKGEGGIVVTDTQAVDFTFILPEGALTNGFTVEVFYKDRSLGVFSREKKKNVIVAQQFRNMPVCTIN